MGNIKLNLWALKGNANDIKNEINKKEIENQNDDNVETNNSEKLCIKQENKQIEEETKTTTKVKISLNELKNKKQKKDDAKIQAQQEKNIQDKKDLEEKKVKNDEVIPLYQKTIEDPLQKILKEQKQQIKDNNQDIKIEKQENKKEIQEEQHSNIQNKKNETQEIFSGYESDFSKEKETIKEKLKKARDFVKPKTRLWFLFLLIWLTFVWIASLFIIAPEVHNLDNYKANLLKIECKISGKWCNEEIKQKQENKLIQKKQQNLVKIEEKEITKYWVTIKYQIKKQENKKDVYIYQNKIYSQKDWERQLDLIIKKIKKQKIKTFLKKDKTEELKNFFKNK